MAPKQLPFRPPDELRRRIDAEARRLGISVNAIIIMYLDRALPPERGGQPEAPAPVATPDDDVADFD